MIAALTVSRLQAELSAHKVEARRDKSTMIAALREHYKVEHSKSSNLSRFFLLGLTRMHVIFVRENWNKERIKTNA